MRDIVSPLSGFSSPFGQRRSRVAGITLAEFSEWFLASGSWDNDGRWLDVATWFPSNWFLSTGSWEIEGIWDDSEGWDITGRFNVVWFLWNGRINVFGFWNDSEAW